ncbi:DUF3891 family protein [Persicitalea jodogahamensis]|uniref:DUF3891 family protein n=1 Tax=Persicitalea jodogahamensis TaxID=402147 RepID=A0A8J3D6C1_9BACT|nr:DUF3891 family protein [Persicitalea jodogahamensis]GHB80871.1 hypothetical protein GCM10007390_39350 [Persicitalea jodogahamensis]
MIVKSIPAGWEVIYQRAHGLLAAKLAFYWKVAERPPHFVETLLAIAEHDDGVPESRMPENLTEAGAPKHFQLLGRSAEQYRSVMEISSSKSRWNALMTSLHTTFLYGDQKLEDADIKEFVAEQKKLQTKITKELGLSRSEAEKHYRFVEWCDALSLLLCMDKVQPEQRRMDISTGPDKTMYQLWQDEKENLHVEPWPFEPDSFEVSVEYRELHQLKFTNSQELDSCLKAAGVGVRSWRFCR